MRAKSEQKIIIAGGGCAGLSLAYQLVKRGFGGHRITLVDRKRKTANDRTWCYWSGQATPFDHLSHHNWSALHVAGHRLDRTFPLRNMHYRMIRAEDFYRYIHQYLDDHQVNWVIGDIQDMGAEKHSAWVQVGNRRLESDWVFNSALPVTTAAPTHRPVHRLLQHFRGWFIRTDQPVFDPQRATLMDFRTPQEGETRFFYILPTSPYEALVEYTIFGPYLWSTGFYEKQIRTYLSQQLGLVNYEITDVEQGVIPMTDQPAPRQKSGTKLLHLGTIGGAVKPTTGYAFLRIQQQAASLARGLLLNNAPAFPPASPARFGFYDTLLLHILQHQGWMGEKIFTNLFRHNRMEKVLTFLDERSHLGQEATIFATLPIIPFLKAVGRCYLRPNVEKAAYPFANPSDSLTTKVMP